MSEIHSSFERDVSGEAPLFVEGKCSACGGRAQRRTHDEVWFHVDVFDPYTVRRAVQCSTPAKFAIFVPEKSRSRRKKFKAVEPHYRTVAEQVEDWENVDEKTGKVPMKTVERPILCTCTNTSCPGWGVPLPDSIKKLRGEA